MKIAIGADHRGAETARSLGELLGSQGHEVNVVASCDGEAVDYPQQAWIVGQQIRSGGAERGILICGTGIGMSIAANKIDGVRAAVVHDELTAQLSRSHNDANVLCLSGDLLGQRLIEKIAGVWLETEFEGGRHGRRVDKIARIEEGSEPG